MDIHSKEEQNISKLTDKTSNPLDNISQIESTRSTESNELQAENFLLRNRVDKLMEEVYKKNQQIEELFQK